jgi:hypothetical protein
MPMGPNHAQTTAEQGLLRLVAEHTSDLQTVVSATGTYQFTSASGAASFGWRPVDLLGEPCSPTARAR